MAAAGFVEALDFAKGSCGLVVDVAILASERVQGAAPRAGGKQRILRRKDPLVAEALALLELDVMFLHAPEDWVLAGAHALTTRMWLTFAGLARIALAPPRRRTTRCSAY